MKNMNENGRSMVEMLGVLAIIGVLSAGGLAGYSKAMFKHKLNSTMDQITMLVTNIRTMYGTQGNYNGLTPLTAYKLGIIPETMVKVKSPSANFALSNPFKGGVAIATSTTKSGGTDGTAFTVTYSGLPKEACLALATADFGSGAGSGYIGVNVGASATDKVYVGTGSGTNGRAEGESYSMADALASTACGAAGENHTVSWKFY